MKNNILLISEDYIKTNSNLNENAFGKWLLPAIREAQDIGLKPVIGECLYNKICELIQDNLISNIEYVAYKDLLDDYIQPYLLYQTLSNIVPIVNGKLANMGAVLTTDEHIVSLSQGESDLLQNYYQIRSDFYVKRLQDFIKNNRSAFKELDACDCKAIKPNLDSSNNSSGIWLGGLRGRILVDNGCCDN